MAGGPDSGQAVGPEDFVKWCHAVVNRKYGAGFDQHDDYVSEMLIAMWRAEATHDPEKGSKASWLVKAAELRLGALGHHGKPFGHLPRETQRMHNYNITRAMPHAKDSRRTEVDEIHWERIAPGVQEDLEPRTFDPAEGAIIAYHRGEIALAMKLLTEAQRRATTKVLTDELMNGRERAAWNAAKPKLREALAHLEDM